MRLATPAVWFVTSLAGCVWADAQSGDPDATNASDGVPSQLTSDAGVATATAACDSFVSCQEQMGSVPSFTAQFQHAGSSQNPCVAAARMGQWPSPICRVTAAAPFASNSYPGASAGTLSVANVSGAHDTLEYSDGGYPPGTCPDWSSGDTLVFSATGAAVPAFTASIGAPNHLESTVSEFVASRSDGGLASWTPGNGDIVYVAMAWYNGVQAGGATCCGPDTGSLKVPPDVVSQFPGDGGYQFLAVLARDSSEEIPLAGSCVRVGATSMLPQGLRVVP